MYSLSTLSEPSTMSSREIARLTGKRHYHIRRDIIRVLRDADIDASTFGYTYKDTYKRNQLAFKLPRRECLLVVSNYSTRLRLKIIDRLEELERHHSRPLSHTIPIERRDLALMVLQAEDEKDSAIAEASRLQDLCNTTAQQFVPGTTPAHFCKQLNGVNVQKVQSLLANQGILISEGRSGFRPSSKYRDKYFKHHVSQYQGEIRNQSYLTQRGCTWLYKKYLKGELPMKSDWNGEYTHDLTVCNPD